MEWLEVIGALISCICDLTCFIIDCMIIREEYKFRRKNKHDNDKR